MQLALSQEGDSTVVELTGELDISSASAVRGELACVAGTTRHLVLDLAGVTFIDSSGLGTIIEAQRTLRNDFCELTIRNPSDAARHVLTISGLTDHIHISDGPPRLTESSSG